MSDQKYEPRATYTTEEELALWIACRAAISRGQSYQMNLPGGGTQMKTFADLRVVNDTIRELRLQLDSENAANGGEQAVNYARFRRG